MKIQVFKHVMHVAFKNFLAVGRVDDIKWELLPKFAINKEDL